MRYFPAPLYHTRLADVKQRLKNAFEAGLEKDGSRSGIIFFRADDIAVPSQQFTKMITLFKQYALPLCLAAVPTWLNRTRLTTLQQITGKSRQFCWHQHGWRHKNHELSGKKQEFGPSRSDEAIRNDLARGKSRLQNLLEDDFAPFFTPPWNRCSTATLKSLNDLHFRGISRSSGALPHAPQNFPDLQINIDLHTRKERDAGQSLSALLEEIENGLSSGRAGVMLHHQRINAHAFIFLEIFLQIVNEHPGLRPVNFEDLL